MGFGGGRIRGVGLGFGLRIEGQGFGLGAWNSGLDLLRALKFGSLKPWASDWGH